MATKINYENSNEVFFKEIEDGEIFNSHGYLFIRTENAFQYVGETLNAIRLEDGAFTYFEDYNEVRKVDVVINVKHI